MRVVAPVKVLAPESVSAPVPLFVRPPVPLIVPANRVVPLFAPAVRVAVPRLMVPDPAIEPTVSAKLLRLKLAPESTYGKEADKLLKE